MDNLRVSRYSRINDAFPGHSGQNTTIELRNLGNAAPIVSGKSFTTRQEYVPLQSDGDDQPDSGKPIRNRRTSWNPPFLRKRTLGTFALLFAAIAAALQILHSVSQKNQGIANSDDSKRYLWTYGPTAILVLVTSLWRQVDYAGMSHTILQDRTTNHHYLDSKIDTTMGGDGQGSCARRAYSAAKLCDTVSDCRYLACTSQWALYGGCNDHHIFPHQSPYYRFNRPPQPADHSV